METGNTGKALAPFHAIARSFGATCCWRGQRKPEEPEQTPAGRGAKIRERHEPLPDHPEPGAAQDTNLRPATRQNQSSVLFLGLLEPLGFFLFFRRLGRRLLDILLCVLALAHGMLSVVECGRSTSSIRCRRQLTPRRNPSGMERQSRELQRANRR